MFSLDESIKFEKYANPHSWFLVASELHEKAKSLKTFGSSKISRVDYEQNKVVNWKNYMWLMNTYEKRT